MTTPEFRIHPAIGIARVGDAPRDGPAGAGWFAGRERIGVPAGYDAVTGRFRDFKSASHVLAQAARFRIFRYDGGRASEVAVGDADVASVTWTVRVANRKAAFFKFAGPLGQRSLYGNPLLRLACRRRNASVAGQERRRALLEQHSGDASIGWGGPGRVVLGNDNAGTREAPYPIERLGEIRVDARGRLIVTGGYGRSIFLREIAPRVDPSRSIVDYANNDGWFDDVSDGPVTAVVVLKDGRRISVDGARGAWVICGPPDFAPAVPPVRSMWDTLIDVFIRQRPQQVQADPALSETHWAELAGDWNPVTNRLQSFTPSFRRDIYPLLRAAAAIRGVFGLDPRPIAHQRFDDGMLARLSDRGEAARAERRALLARIRPHGTRAYDLHEMPLAHGDFVPLEGVTRTRRLLGGLAAPLGILPRTLLSVSAVQYALLERWADGAFVDDWSSPPAAAGGDAVGPHELDQAALEGAVGGAFFPGIEASWLLTDDRVYAAPFRLDSGRTLRARTALGPLRIEAGLFTAQMALPWQADFASCARTPSATGLTQVAWWPSQRPDDVYVRDASGRLQQVPWTRGIDADPDENARHQDMVDHWSQRGFVIEEQPGVFREQ